MSEVIYLKTKQTEDREILLPKGKMLLEYVKQYDRMKAALRKISEMPYDDMEDEDGSYKWLREDEVRDYHNEAINISYKALMGKD